MRDSAFGDGLWAFVVIGGFLILAAAIAWAKLSNRTSRRKAERTEAATRELYDEGTTEGKPR
jgi:hypothetical protein